MKFFVDTADVNEIRELSDTGLLDDLESKTYAYSSYFLIWVCPISKIKHLKSMNSRQLF